MKVLVTGANGLLGQKLVALLSNNKQYNVSATGKGTQRIPAGGFSYFSANLTEKKEVSELFDKVRPHAVIHCAAMTQVDDCELNQTDCWNINVNSVKYLLASAEKHQTYFSYISTDFVFNGKEGPYSETDKPDPVNFYGLSKQKAEDLVGSSRLNWSIVRTVLVYGVGYDLSRSNIVLWVKKSLEAGRPISVVKDQSRTPTLVEDLAIGCALILEKKANGIFHLSGDETMTPYEMALSIADHYNLEKPLITSVTASTFKEIGKRPPKTGFIISKARKELGFQPTGFTEGLDIVRNQLAK